MSLNVEAIEELPPEHSGSLTFHLPLELAALELAGASASVIAERTERRLQEAYASGLVDPPLYRWAVDHYRDVAADLLDDDPEVRGCAFAAIDTLGDGIVGAAFHGVIRLGYGLWRRRPDEVARGLAYLRSRRQVLTSSAGRADERSFDHPHLDGSTMPSVAELDGQTVFDVLNIAAGVPDADALLPAGDGPVTAHRLMAGAAALVARNPLSFVAVHAVTGLHGLCEVQHAVFGPIDPYADVTTLASARWWNAYAVALGAASLVMAQYPPEAVPAVQARVDTVDRLLDAAIASGETHDLKLVLALRRLQEFAVLDASDVLRVGSIKLASTEGVAS
ncbi:MAG: hypothetical protein AB7V43_02205 [Acidimicrobiia bacterium]